MGFFDFFKKKKADGGKLRSFRRNTSVANVTDMIEFGLKWRDKLIEQCFSHPSSKVKAEALIYTCWRVWYYCLEEGKVSRDEDYIVDFVARLMVNLQNYYDDKIFKSVQLFNQLYSNRFVIYREDLVGLCTSNYPVTKQYLPIDTYRALNLDPLRIINPGTSTLSMEQMDDMVEFVGKFIHFLNEMLTDMHKVF